MGRLLVVALLAMATSTLFKWVVVRGQVYNPANIINIISRSNQIPTQMLNNYEIHFKDNNYIYLLRGHSTTTLFDVFNRNSNQWLDWSNFKLCSYNDRRKLMPLQSGAYSLVELTLDENNHAVYKLIIPATTLEGRYFLCSTINPKYQRADGNQIKAMVNYPLVGLEVGRKPHNTQGGDRSNRLKMCKQQSDEILAPFNSRDVDVRPKVNSNEQIRYSGKLHVYTPNNVAGFYDSEGYACYIETQERLTSCHWDGSVHYTWGKVIRTPPKDYSVCAGWKSTGKCKGATFEHSDENVFKAVVETPGDSSKNISCLERNKNVDKLITCVLIEKVSRHVSFPYKDVVTPFGKMPLDGLPNDLSYKFENVMIVWDRRAVLGTIAATCPFTKLMTVRGVATFHIDTDAASFVNHGDRNPIMMEWDRVKDRFKASDLHHHDSCFSLNHDVITHDSHTLFQFIPDIYDQYSGALKSDNIFYQSFQHQLDQLKYNFGARFLHTKDPSVHTCQNIQSQPPVIFKDGDNNSWCCIDGVPVLISYGDLPRSPPHMNNSLTEVNISSDLVEPSPADRLIWDTYIQHIFDDLDKQERIADKTQKSLHKMILNQFNVAPEFAQELLMPHEISNLHQCGSYLCVQQCTEISDDIIEIQSSLKVKDTFNVTSYYLPAGVNKRIDLCYRFPLIYINFGNHIHPGLVLPNNIVSYNLDKLQECSDFRNKHTIFRVGGKKVSYFNSKLTIIDSNNDNDINYYNRSKVKLVDINSITSFPKFFTTYTDMHTEYLPPHKQDQVHNDHRSRLDIIHTMLLASGLIHNHKKPKSLREHRDISAAIKQRQDVMNIPDHTYHLNRVKRSTSKDIVISPSSAPVSNEQSIFVYSLYHTPEKFIFVFIVEIVTICISLVLSIYNLFKDFGAPDHVHNRDLAFSTLPAGRTPTTAMGDQNMIKIKTVLPKGVKYHQL